MAQPLNEPPNSRAAIQRLLREVLNDHRRFLAFVRHVRQLLALPAEDPPPGLKNLTPTEKKLIRRIVATDDKLSAIWSELGMGKRTFDTHLDSIYRKLDTRKRSGLARVAIMWGVM